eukprot:32897-Eustigmatos_ZCMA.PRE.1
MLWRTEIDPPDPICSSAYEVPCDRCCSVSRCEAEDDHFCCDSGRRFDVCSVKDGKFLCQ